MLGGNRDRFAEAEAERFDAPSRPACPSALLATRITGLPARRTAWAKCRSAGGHAGPRVDHEQRPRRSRRAPPRSGRACGRPAFRPSPSSRPAVSTMVKTRSPSRASPSRRSRVTPGWSSTSASLRPTSRLNSVDLPTFGPSDDRDFGAHARRGDAALTWPPADWRRRGRAGSRRCASPPSGASGSATTRSSHLPAPS